MATDIVPELNAQIAESFQNRIESDRQLKRIGNRVRDGTATLVDAHDYAERIGENLSAALQQVIVPSALPNETLFYNIALRTVVPALRNNYNLVNLTAAAIQKILDSKMNIGLNAVKADFPQGRVDGLVDKMTADGVEIGQALTWLGEPIINNSEAFFDDFVVANAKFRQQSGMEATITRNVAPNCCAWCAALAGTYEYGTEPKDVYRRHEFCRCTVTFASGRTRQDVWSKKQWQSTPEELETRRNIMPRIQVRR